MSAPITKTFSVPFSTAISRIAMAVTNPNYDLARLNEGVESLSRALATFDLKGASENPRLARKSPVAAYFGGPVTSQEGANDLLGKIGWLLPFQCEDIAQTARRVKDGWPLYRFQIATTLMTGARVMNFSGDVDLDSYMIRAAKEVLPLLSDDQAVADRELRDALKKTVLDIRYPSIFEDYEPDVDPEKVKKAVNSSVAELRGRNIVLPENSPRKLEYTLASLRRVVKASTATKSLKTPVNEPFSFDDSAPTSIIPLHKNLGCGARHVDAEGYLLQKEANGSLRRTPYRLEKIIGEGSFGVVFEAQDTDLRRRVVIKIAKADHDNEGHFADEQRMAARFPKQAATVFVKGMTQTGAPFVVMQILEGVTLQKLIDSRCTLEKAYSLSLKILEAFSALHNDHVVHRDIKPENIYVTKEGDVYVLDFGLAYDLISKVGMQFKSDQVLGTPAYLSLEAWKGGQSDDLKRRDLFALGIVLFELLTGRLPQNESQQPDDYLYARNELVRLFKEFRQIRPTIYNPDVAPLVDSFVAKCLEQDPLKRFADIQVAFSRWPQI
ncbi:MAG: serine/threonine protein kinase [Deltaproteobacteria bacterium]|nr:MAG: serine/threonine protein kinase [Deltaproteobacteria bacterium]